MASQVQAANSEQQASRMIDPSICTACGIDRFSNQQLNRKINILQNQHNILNDQLFRSGHINQLNELRIRTISHEREGYAALAESSKQAAASLQKQLDNQQATFEIQRRECAIAVESLKHESARREVTERSLEHEKAVVQKMTSILDKVELPTHEISAIGLPENMGLGTLVYEWEGSRSEVKTLRNELQRMADELRHKQLVLENLSGNFGVQSQSMSENPFYDSDEEASVEVAELQAVSRVHGVRR